MCCCILHANNVFFIPKPYFFNIFLCSLSTLTNFCDKGSFCGSDVASTHRYAHTHMSSGAGFTRHVSRFHLICFPLCFHAGDWDYHCLDPAVWHVSVSEVSGSCFLPYSQWVTWPPLPASLCHCSTQFRGSHPKRATTWLDASHWARGQPCPARPAHSWA